MGWAGIGCENRAREDLYCVGMVHRHSLLYFVLFCETRDLVCEIFSVSETRLKNCTWVGIVKIIDVFQKKMLKEGYLVIFNSYYFS